MLIHPSKWLPECERQICTMHMKRLFRINNVGMPANNFHSNMFYSHKWFHLTFLYHLYTLLKKLKKLLVSLWKCTFSHKFNTYLKGLKKSRKRALSIPSRYLQNFLKCSTSICFEVASKGVPKISLFLLSSHIIFWAEENRWRKTFGFHGLIEKVFAYHLCRLAGKIIGTRYTADSLINLDTPVEFQAFVLTGYLISYLSEA